MKREQVQKVMKSESSGWNKDDIVRQRSEVARIQGHVQVLNRLLKVRHFVCSEESIFKYIFSYIITGKKQKILCPEYQDTYRLSFQVLIVRLDEG